MARIGYDNVVGYLGATVPAWAAAGHKFRSIPTLDVEQVEQDWKSNERVLLDVRGREELGEGMVPGAKHIYVGELPRRLNSLDPKEKYTLLCASGVRSTIAAAVLLKAGFQVVAVFLGSMSAWQQACKAVTAKRPPLNSRTGDRPSF